MQFAVNQQHTQWANTTSDIAIRYFNISVCLFAKIPEESAHGTTSKQVGASKESRTQRGKNKNKFLSQTKINPKIKNTLQIKGFSSNAPEGNKGKIPLERV